jgi:hypothetical protein
MVLRLARALRSGGGSASPTEEGDGEDVGEAGDRAEPCVVWSLNYSSLKQSA